MKTIKPLFGTLMITLALSVQAQNTLTNGLVAYYPFNGNANDASGNGNNGNVAGAVLTTDRFNQSSAAYYFNGTNSSIGIPAFFDLGQPNYTISFWFNTVSTQQIDQYFLNSCPNPTLQLEYNQTINSAEGFVSYSIGVGNNWIQPTQRHGTKNDYQSNTWYQVAFVKQGSQFSIFIDGNLDNTSSAAVPDTGPVGFVLGQVCNSSTTTVNPGIGFGLLGKLDDVRFYNRALSTNEVQQLYAYESQAQTILTNGLVAYYPFNGDANDESGNGNNGTVNGAILTSDRFSQPNSAYLFNGVNSYIQLEKNFPDMTNMTVSAWVQYTSGSYINGQGTILDDSDTTASNDFEFGVSDSTDAIIVATKSGYSLTQNVPLGRSISNVWVQLIWVITGSGSIVYLDGVSVFTTIQGGNNTGLHAPPIIGATSSEVPFVAFFGGKIDDLRIYNRALSGLEVQQLYAYESRAQTVLTNGLVAYYPFNGDAYDYSGNGNNGIVNGAQSATDRFGNPAGSYSFTAYPQSIATSGSAGFPSGTNDFSISVWLTLSFIPTNDAQIIFCNAVRNDLQLNFSPSTATTSVMDFWTGGSVLHTPDFAWVPQQWYNLQVVRSQNVVTIYRNGIVIGQNQTANGVSAPPASDYLQFGLGVPPQIHQFYGQLDDIRVYNRALSASEVQQLYQFEGGPNIGLIKAVKPFFSNLTLTTNYQLQVSTDLTTWTNTGSPFTATNSSMVYPQYFDVDNWNELFFRLQTAP
jgi:hypothetical protein